MTTIPAPGDDIPVTEGGVWEPDYPVPATVDELWRTARARGWSMTRETIPGSYSTDRFKVVLEARTVVGHWKFGLEWGLRKGRYAADKQRSWAWWPDGRTGPRGGEVHPTVDDALNVMRRYEAVTALAGQEPSEPVDQATVPTDQVITSSAGPSSAVASDATPAPAADSRYVTRDVEGMPGYWWREEPPRATDRYTTERVTVGFGDDTIGEAHGPGWQGRTGWTIPDDTELVHGGQTSSECAKLLATRHQAQQQTAPVAGTSAAVSAGHADESPGMPFDAQEVAGMPGYWWRLEPPREGARDDIERITVGYGTEQIGHGHGPNGSSGAVKWTIVVGTDYMPGERTPSASAKKIAERHQALQEAALVTGPRPAEVVWIRHERDHGSETRTYVFGVAESDKDALAALDAEDFIPMPSANAWVQRKGTRPETRAYKTGLFVRRMLKHGRSIAVHYSRDGAPADTALPELDNGRRGELDALTEPERRDWSPLEFQAGDHVLLKGSHSWWHTVTDVQPGQLSTELETALYSDVLARRRGQDLLTAADPVGEITTARPGSISLRGAAPAVLEAEQARLELPLADAAHAPFVEARRAQIATERARVSGVLAGSEKRRVQMQAILDDQKELKRLSGRLVHNEAGELLGAVVSRDKMPDPPRTRKQSRKWIFVDRDGNAVGALDRKGDAEQFAIDREDDLHAVVPVGWRGGAFTQIEPGEAVRLPDWQGRRLTPESWTPEFIVTSIGRNADGSVTVDGTRQGTAVSYHLSAKEAETGPLRKAVGELALLPETIVVRAARPALLAALEHPTDGVAFPFMGHDELTRARQAVTAAAKAIEGRPTSLAKLREQVSTARDALALLAEVASADGVDLMPERARAAIEVMEFWAAQLEDLGPAAARLMAAAAPAADVQSAVDVPAAEQSRTADSNASRDEAQSPDEAAGPGQGASGEAAEQGRQPEASETPSASAQARPEDSSVSLYDAMRLGGQEVARALLARVTVGEFAADGEFLRARVLLDGEDIGSVVTRPDGGYAATTIENHTTRHPYETVSGAVAQVVQSYDEWVVTGEEREARARELGLGQMPAAPDGELPEGVVPVPGFPDYHQVSAYPGTVVYGPGNRKIGSVENRTYNQGKHKTLYGDDSPIKGHDTIERSVRHLLEVHAELNDVPDNQMWLNVWIEHHPDHTNVWGASEHYRELAFALEVAGGPRGFNRRNGVDVTHRQHGTSQHTMPTNLTYESRTEKINMLRVLLSARGREIPVFESLEAKQEAEAADRAQTATPAAAVPARQVGAEATDDAAPAARQEHTAPVGQPADRTAQGQAAHGTAIHEMDVDDLDEAIEALKDATDPLSLAYRLRAERRRWALLRQEAEDWVPQPEYDAEGNLVEPSRGQILRERADGYRLNPNEAQGAVTSVDDLPPAKPGGYSDARWAEIVAAAAGDEAFPPTAEQDIIIEAAARRGLDLRVMALAGTGKSTTLKMLSRRMPGKRILYLAFNRSVADEAIEAQQRGEYSDNLTPTTANAYANSMVDEALLTRLNWPKLNEQQLADRMRWRSRIRAGGESLSPQQAAYLANRLLTEWAKSADDEFAAHHLPDTLSNREAIFAAIRPLAAQMWDNLTDPEATNKDRDLPLSFDHTVKMWALSGRVPDTDVLMWDEAQDVNPVMESIVANIREAGIRIVAVGDSNQAIYGFRGATDALGRLPADATATLTQTFRFGDAVADIGNRFLRLGGTRMRLAGWDRKTSRITEITPGDETMLIARTNAGVVLGAVEGLRAGRKVAVSGGLSDLRKFLEAAEALREGERTSHQELARFNGMAWDEILETAESEPELKQLDSMFKLMERHSEELDALLESVRMPRPFVEDDGERLWVKFAFGDGNFRTTKEWLKSKGVDFGWDEEGKRWGYPSPKKPATATDAARHRRRERVEQYIADHYIAPANENGGQIVDQSAPHDLVVSTAHKAKGLESERVRIAGDFRGPKESVNGGIDWDTIPDDEQLRLDYVAVTRATDVLDAGSLGWIFDVTRDDDPMKEPDGIYLRAWQVSDVQPGNRVTFWSEDGESLLDGEIAELDGTALLVRTEDGSTAPVVTGQIVRREGQDRPHLPVASDEELDEALNSGQFVPPMATGPSGADAPDAPVTFTPAVASGGGGAPKAQNTPSAADGIGEEAAVGTLEASEQKASAAPLTADDTPQTAPDREAFTALKPPEAQALTAPDGTLWWGGKASERKKAMTQPVLVRLKFGQRGVVDVENAVTGENIDRIRTGTSFFAAAPLIAEQQEPSTSAAASQDAAPAEETAHAAQPATTTGDVPVAADAPEPAATAAQEPTIQAPAFKVVAWATDAGRRWAVVDRAGGDAVWIRPQGQEPFEAVFTTKAAAERSRSSLILAPDLRVPAPDPAAPAPGTTEAQRHEPGPALAPVLGKVIAKDTRGTDQLVKVQVGDEANGVRGYLAWNPVGADQVQLHQLVYLSGTLGAETSFHGRLETPVEGGTVEGEQAAHDRRNLTQPAPEGWIPADPSTLPALDEGQQVRILDPHHPAHAASGQPDTKQLYSTVTVELVDNKSYAGTSADGRVLVFTRDQVVAVPSTGTSQPQQTAPAPEPAAEQDVSRDVSAALLARLRSQEFPYAKRAGRWTVADLQPRPDGSPVEVLLRKNGEWAQAVGVGPHTLRDQRGNFHGLEEVLAWRDATQLVTLLDRPERTPNPGLAAPVLVQDSTPKPPLSSSPPQSTATAELESQATALNQWLNTYAAQGDTGASVRAVEQRDALRAELEQRRLRRRDAEQLGGMDGFRQDLDALTLETPDPSGVQVVLRHDAPLGTVVASADGYRFVPDGQLALAEGTAYASPEGAAVALSRFLAGVPENQPLHKPAGPAPIPAPRFVLTDEDKFVHTADGEIARTADGKKIPTGADSNMLLKAHLSGMVRYKDDPDQRSQQMIVELCRKHGKAEAGTHLSSGGRLAIITVAPERYEVRAPDRLTKVFGPWGEQIKTRERANRIADALESIRDEQGRPFPWDMPNPTRRALPMKALHWKDEHGHDIRQAILHALVTRGLDERDRRYAKEYYESTGRRLTAPAVQATPRPAPQPTDPSMPAPDAFVITNVKQVLGEVAAADGTFWWKGEVNNPQATQLRSSLVPLEVPVLVRIEESADEKGASIGWVRVLDAATGEPLLHEATGKPLNVRSTSHVLVASPLAPATPAGGSAPAQRRFASLGQVRTHLMAAKIPGLTPERRTDVRKLAKDRELVDLTDDGQFAIRQTGETFEVLPAGSGLPFDGLLPGLYLTPDASRDLAVTPQPLEGLPSLEEARDFAGRLTELRTTTGEPIDWSDPQLGTRLSTAELVHLNHTVLEERAHHDRANENANSPSDAMWRLFEDQPQRPDQSTDTMRWADTLTPSDWVWLRINDEDKAWEVIERTDTQFGTVAITLDDDSTWHLPRNLSVQHPGDDIVTTVDGEPIGLRLTADFVLDDDVIEFDLAPDGTPLAPTGAAGIAAPDTTRIRGRARVTHHHPHGGGERTYLMDATIVNGEDIEPTPVELATTAFELPEHVYRLSLRAPLAYQEAQPQPPSLARPVTASRQEADAELVEDLGIRFPIRFANELRDSAELKAELAAELAAGSAPDLDIEAEIDATLELAAELEADLEAASALGTDTESDFAPEPEPEDDAPDTELDREQDLGPREEAGPHNVTALPTRLPEGEELRQSFLRLLNAPDAPTTPTEHTVLDDAPLYVRVAHSPRHGRVVQFGFDPTSPRAAAQFTAAELEGASGEQVLRGVMARHPHPQPLSADHGPLTLDRLRRDLLKLMDNPGAPSVPTLQRKMSGLNLYVAVTGHPEHGTVLRFGFDAKSAPAGLFTRDDLQGATSDKVVQIVERYGEAFVQQRIDTDRARRLRNRVQAGARQRQIPRSPSPAASSGPLSEPRPDEHGRHAAPTASPSR
ncbi:UvrD-helicase domain-containing protein [Streptomyces sp. NPDC058145]|uniref:UvrD-helicase domain-containing protein n=1 Tax=Streptomyces sp. NPDC058145 TaxID=3346356 RepID=UPI0036E71596